MTDEKPSDYSSLASSHPPNSRKSREQKAIQPIAMKGTVSEPKKSLSQRISESFTGDDARTVGNYILLDVIIPMAKDMLFSALSEAASRILFGSSSRASSIKSNGYTAYNMISKVAKSGRDEPRLSPTDRANHDFRGIVLSSRDDAMEILQNLRNTLEEYQVVMVPDLYAMIGETPKFVDEKYGWTNLSSASVRHVANGWFLDLPKPVEIE